MQTLNKIEYDELSKKITDINNLINRVENSFKNIDNIINDNVNSGKGIWDGEDAYNFKNDWSNLKENVPIIIDIYKKQAENIENVIKQTTIQ